MTESSNRTADILKSQIKQLKVIKWYLENYGVKEIEYEIASLENALKEIRE